MPDIPSVSSNYRLSNPSLPTEFILALDAEKSEANRLRQQLAAKDHELSKLRMEKTNELKRMSLQSLSTNNEQLNQLELSNEDLKARLMDLELDREQLKMELESAKIGLENEVKYRGIEREQAKTQMIALTSERDAALKEVAGKSVVLGSTEMIVNQTTKELAGLRNRERELTAKVADQNVQIKNQAQALVESEEKLKRAVGEVQNRSVMIRNTEERLRGLIQEMGNARAREADLVRKLQESEARLVDSSSAFEDFKKVSAENLYQAKQVEEQLRIETRDLQNQLNQVIHGSRLRDEEIKKNRDLIQGMAGRIGTMDREIGNGKAMINERDQKISAMNRDLMTAAQKEEDLLQQIQLLNQSHGGEMAQALTITQNHQRELEKIRGERDDLADKLAVSVKEAQELQEAKRSLEENIVALNNRISALDNELGVSQTLADETVIKIRQLTDDLNRASAKDRKMQEDQKQMQNRFAELDTIAQRLVADRDGWRNRSAELERLLDQSRKESGDMALMKENLERDLRQEIADGQLLLQSHIADHNQATILLRGNISNIEISLAEAKARGDELSALSTSLQGKLEASIQNEKYLTEQIQILKEARGGDMAAALDRTEKHQRELQALISERNGLQERLTELEAVLQHLVSDRDGWKSRAEGLEAELDSIAIRHMEATNLLRKTLEDSITQISNRLETVESEKAVLDARNAETIKTLQSQLHAAQVHRVGLESQIAALKKDLFEALNNDHELVVQGLNDRLDESEKTQKSLNDKISELLSTIKMKEKEKLDMQANINELEETIDELMIEQDASEKKVLKLQAAVKKAKQEVVDIERTTDASITHLRDESAFAIKRAQDEFNRTLWNVRMEMNSLVAAITQSEKEDEMDEMSGSVDVDGIFKDMRTCRQKALEWVVTINVASSESEAATQNVAVLKNQINSLNKQLGDAKREVEDFMFQLEETKELDGRQKQQIKILEQQVAKANKLKEDAEKKAISSTTESEEMVLALQQEIISIRGELSKKNEVLKRTTPAEIQEFLKSGESELAEAKNATATAEKELRAVQRMVQEKESDIAKLQEEFDGLKQQLAETRDLAQKDTDSYKSMIEGLKAQLKQERDSLSEAQEAVVNCQTMIRDLETLRNEMVMKFERQLDDKESAYVKVVTNLDAANSEIDELKYECEDLESKLQAAHTNTEALEANYQSIKDEIELLRNQRRESIEAMQSMIQSLQLRLQEEQELVEVNQTKWNEEQATHLKLVAQLETDLQEKNVHLQKLTTSSTASADEIKTLRAEIATLTVQLEDKEASFAQSLAKVTKDLETSVAEIAKLKLQLQEATAALETEKQKHEAELTALRSVVSNLESDLKLAKQQSADMSASSASAVESSSKQLADLKTKLDQVEASLAQAQKDLSESRTASADSAKEVESCKAVILELESKAKDAAEQVSKLNSEITLARELKAAGEEGGNAAVDALKKALEEQEGRLSGQVEALKKELADSVERVKVLEGQVALGEGVSKEVESVKAELARAQAEVERLNGELEKAKEAAVPTVAAASDSDTPELATAKAEVARLQEKLNESTSKAQESDKLKSELDAALADVSRLQDLIEETKSALSSEHQKDYKAIKESLDKTITERDDLKAELSVFRAHARAAADDADDDDLPPPPPIPKDVAGALSAKNSPRTSIAESVKSTKSVVSPTSSTVGRKSLTGKLYGLVGSAIGYK
ncbi:hypothetical protein BCR33DRAFT_395487 [Rhizoclosmatium globosum]|uniref:Uncharacterized protein n=1 Tax=Rhizoclosmatium globosum TaxID=329046 RepID=A0A1Y2CXM4_9FUNG|nr:hypothetical protein BCR33DRAFT_395487 [Rhizoclosmatium globosum]|eukprot:ORY51781.1 hypothetical protein BCR33DRAFT_395487 [Rhizoclosmatium globosum]